MSTDAKAYFEKEGLVDLVNKYNKNESNQIPAHFEDLVRLHKTLRSRKSFTAIEFGVGFSTVVIADALRKNKADWESLSNAPATRNRFMFQLFSVDASKKWIENTKNKLPEELTSYVNFHFSEAEIGLHNGQLCSFYKNLPDVIADFIYIDAPDPKDVKGSINGLSFQCDERTVTSADLLLMESTLLPGAFIVVDGRLNNVRFLENNMKRKYKKEVNDDVTTFELDEPRLGKYNILGSDFFKK